MNYMNSTVCDTSHEEDMYKAVCAIEGCDQILHIDMPTHIWGKADPKSELGYTDEMCICDYCHQDLENELHEEGWKHDEDEDCDWF